MVLYFVCSGLGIMGVVGFCMLVGVGILLPNVGQACRYVDAKLET